MNRKAIVTKTAKGMREACGATRSLGRDLKAFLKAVDGKSTPDDLAARLGKLSEAAFNETLERLMAEGYIQEIPLDTGDEWDLDFTSADIQREIKAEARRKAEETARRWAAERARRRAEERERREAEKRAKREAEERARREAEEARQAAEAQAKRAAEERVRQEAEALAKREAEERMRREAEARAVREAQERARRAAEEAARKAAAERARREEEQARRKAEEDRRAAEAEAKRAAEERARQEAEALAKREAEEQARREAEARAVREAEERARLAAEEAARKAAAERAQREAEEQARLEAEKERQAAEAEAKRAAEERARQEAEALAKREAEEQMRREAEACAAREAEERARLAAEEAARKADAERAQREAEEQARLEAEKERQAAEAEAKRAAEERARQEAEALAKREAEEQERREAEERIRLEAAARALSAAQEHVRRAAETIASKEADHHAWSEIGQQSVRPADEAPRIEVAAQASRESVAREGRAARKRRERQERQERQERREREAARREAEARSTRDAERGLREVRAAIADKPVLKRLPVRWGRPFALSLLVLLTAGLLLLHLMPFDSQRARFEKLAGEQFQHPVSIGAVHFSLLPRPHWNLDGVTIGSGRQVQAPRIRLIVGPYALLHDAIAFETVEVEAPVLTEEGLGWLLLGKAHGRGFSVARVEARGAVLQAKNFALPSFDVHAEWGDDGNWRRMQLGFAGTDLTVRLAPADDAVEFSLQSIAFAPPFLPGLPALGDFNAEGTARRGELQVTRFDGRVHGGVVAGSARLRFDGDLALEGEVNAKGIDMVKLIPGLFEDGQLDGAATFVLPAVPEAGKPGPAPRMAGSFAVRRGVLAGIDMGSALKNNSLGGRTRFGRLEGMLAVENGGVQLRRLQLDAGAMSAKGNVDVAADRSLHGRIDVALAAAAVRRHVALDLSGAFKEPYLKNADWTRR